MIQKETSRKVELILEKLASMEQLVACQEFVPSPAARSTADGAVAAGGDLTTTIPIERVQTRPQEPQYWTLSQRSRTRCLRWCSCQCHSRYSVRSPWIIRTIVGLSSVEYMSGTRPCNDRTCRRPGVTKIGMTFRLPKHLVGRYIAIAISYSTLQGPVLSLQVPRIMPWCHTLWNYASQGDLEAIQTMFMEGRASPHDVNPRGASALLYSVPYPKLTRLLVQHGADLNLKDDRGRAAVDLLGVVLLSGKLAPEDSHIIKSILDCTDYEQTRNFTSLHKIVLGISHKDLDSELADSLVNLDAVDASGQTPLAWAVIRDNFVTVSKLLSSGANPNVRDNSGSTPLYYVQSPEICKILLEHGANIHNKNSIYNRGPLHNICKRVDCVNLVAMILSAGADVDETDADNETPLMNAIFRHATDTARYLIDVGASVNAFNISSQDRLLHFAVTFNHHDILQYLIDKGAEYTATNVYGRNIAHMAARYGDARTMSIIANADLNDLDVTLKDLEGKTAADYLAERDILSEPENGIHQHSRKLLQRRSTTPCSRIEGLAPLHCYYVPGSFP